MPPVPGPKRAEQQDVVVHRRIAAKCLRTVDAADTAVDRCACAQVGQCRTGAGFGQRNGPRLLTAQDRRQIPGFLLRIPPTRDEHPRPGDCHHRRSAGSRTGMGDALDRQDAGNRGFAGPADLLRQANAEHAEFAEDAHVLGRTLIHLPVLECFRPELLHCHAIDHIDQFAVFLRQAEIHFPSHLLLSDDEKRLPAKTQAAVRLAPTVGPAKRLSSERHAREGRR